MKIGFFLHVPFPSSEVFRQFPKREEILKSLLTADLVGFHDYSYLRHFCSSVLRMLGLDTSFLAIRNGSHTTRLGVFPVSVETEDLQNRAATAKVGELLKKYKSNEFLFLGVDRRWPSDVVQRSPPGRFVSVEHTRSKQAGKRGSKWGSGEARRAARRLSRTKKAGPQNLRPSQPQSPRRSHHRGGTSSYLRIRERV